ncbi:hypothetical protein [Mucilaginibacter ginsenosidivorax]|uniref:hypothetical protein n=1 Tax=Mucilaginibacter ginsenosidivorax TaxID=862126 RepID=UPI00131587AC|nr:hypothetical protein [Mucilaginibacter ginsenosidivorax]
MVADKKGGLQFIIAGEINRQSGILSLRIKENMLLLILLLIKAGNFEMIIHK